MKQYLKAPFMPTIIWSLILAAIGFVISFIPIFVENDWHFSGLKLSEFSFFTPLVIFTISIATNIVLSTLTDSHNDITKLPQFIKNNIQDVITDSIFTLKSDIEEFKRKLSSGIVKHEKYTYRALIYYEDHGIIKNGFSGDVESSRNILFSNKTINLIFREIRKLDQHALKNIGLESSSRFAQDLVTSIREKESSTDLYDWIIDWISFDSDAGFGKFELGSPTPEAWKDNLTIILKHSFLTTDSLFERNQEHKICDYMSGYIEGILNVFPHSILAPYNLKPHKILITHDIEDSDECIGAGREPSEGCIFHIKSK